MRKVTLTNEIENLTKGSVVMTPGYASGVRIIGVSTSTVLQTPTQEAPLSKTSAFVKPETIAQSAEKVLNGETIVGPQQQGVMPGVNAGESSVMPNIFPQVATQTPPAQQNYVPVMESQQTLEAVPVQVNSPETLNTLVTPQLDSTTETFETAPQSVGSEVVMPAEMNLPSQELTSSSADNNMQQVGEQYTPSQEILTPAPMPVDNNFTQTSQYPEQPPVLPTEFVQSEDIADKKGEKSETLSKIVSLLKEMVMANIETNKKILEKIEEIENELKSQKDEKQVEELTTDHIAEPEFGQTAELMQQPQYAMPNLTMPSNEETNVYTMHM